MSLFCAATRKIITSLLLLCSKVSDHDFKARFKLDGWEVPVRFVGLMKGDPISQDPKGSNC
jgi:hypothetical protein